MAQELPQHLSHYMPMGIFLNAHKGSEKSAVGDRKWMTLELVQDIMIVLVINKNEEDQSKKEAAKVVPTLKTIFQILKGSKLRSQWYDLVEFLTDFLTCKNEEDPLKNKGASC